MSIVINMLGGPGRGKSTSAYSLIGSLKRLGYKAELLTEYVKWAAYKEDSFELNDQLYMMVKHNHRLSVLEKLVDIVVTDTSLINCIGYTFKYRTLALNLYNSHPNNINILVPRKEKYMKYGRVQTEDEAKYVDEVILKTLKEKHIEYAEFQKDNLDAAILQYVVDEATKQGITVNA